MTTGPDSPKPAPWDRLTRIQKIGAVSAVAVLVLVVLGVIGSLTEPVEERAPEAEAPASTKPTPAESQDPAPAPDDAETDNAPQGPDCSDFDDVTSGQSLCEFEDAASYPYRLRLAQNVDTVLPAVQEIAPWTEAQNLTDLYSTCDDLTRGIPETDIVPNAVTRFSGGTGEQLDDQAAGELVAIARREVCPDA